MLGSIKLIYLLVPSVAAMHQQQQKSPQNEDLINLVRFKIELKNFFVEISDYLRSQLAEMNAFILSYSINNHQQQQSMLDDTQLYENSDDTANTAAAKHRTEKARKNEDTKPKRKKVKLDINQMTDDSTHATDDIGKENDHDHDPDENSQEQASGRVNKTAHLNSALIITILRQVDLKRKCLDHIIQVLNQTLNYLQTTLALSDVAVAETLPKENDTTVTSSSGSSSVRSSPLPNEENLEETKKLVPTTEPTPEPSKQNDC